MPSCVVCGTSVENAIHTRGGAVCSEACDILLRIQNLPAEQHSNFVDGDEGYDGILRPCIACSVETKLRCSRCRKPVCHNCEDCPNGCDSVISDSPPESTADEAAPR